MLTKGLKISFAVILTSIVLWTSADLRAQEKYPTRPVEFIVPWAAGSSGDISSRFFADKWTEFLGQPVVVITKPGGGGALGAKFVAHAKADGYTLLSATESANIAARLDRKDAGYDLDSFRHLFAFGYGVLFYTVKEDAKWKTMKDFLLDAKNQPGKLKFATMGPKHAATMTTDMLSKMAGAKLTLVPFKSTPDCLTAVMGGNVDIAVTWGASGLAQSGKIRILAVGSENRLPDLPQVSTLKESGYPIEYTRNLTWVAVPAKTPESVVSKIVEAHSKARVKYAKDIEEKQYLTGQYPIHLDEKATREELKRKEVLFKKFYEQIGAKPE